ncbi:MAG TPA: HNH endonuclease [Iamia sp.]|nr:HNH endonuclease [Iamia sp.]
MSADLIDVDPESLTDAEITAHLLALHRLTARVEGALVAATGVFDRRRLHAADAARTTAGWLAARVDRTRTRSGADVEVARALRAMPVVAAAFRAGRLGRAKVDLLVATRIPEVAEVFAEQEAWLVAEVVDLRVGDANRFLRSWQEAARCHVGSVDPDEPVTEAAPRVAVTLTPTFDGRHVLDGEMDTEHGAIVRAAIDAEVDEMHRAGVFGPEDGLSPAERRGQALVQIVTRQGRTGMRHGRPRPSVEVIVDERTLRGLPIVDGTDLRTRVCEIAGGAPLRPASLHRLLCGADVHRLVISAAGEVLDAGKDIRLANRAQRRALRFRHAGHCAFPGCAAPTDWCEAHHVEPFDPDPGSPRGRTDMANLVPLCRHHHHAVHEGGFTLTLRPDGRTTVTRPGGRCRVTAARRWRRPVALPGSVDEATVDEHRDAPARPDPGGEGEVGVPAAGVLLPA